MKHNKIKKDNREYAHAKYGEFFSEPYKVAAICNQNIRPHIIRISNVEITIHNELMTTIQYETHPNKTYSKYS